ncbi:MAG: methylated-DNA-[protein]-cysteine S-methyltransferase [Parcubacteria group bacterium Greene0714_7]|nr:MAG: methylated-DNA-[protein]-cysteine S-methyltransferase [Parcubacteria group bacterium Greene0714_7]
MVQVFSKKFKDDFRARVVAVVKKIPRGKTMSYGQVALAAGRPNAGRAVGTIMAGNQDKGVPCHRVIRSDGKIGGYNGLRDGLSKEELLRKEGAIK